MKPLKKNNRIKTSQIFPSKKRFIILLFLFIVIIGEILGVILSDREQYFVNQTMYLDERFVYDNTGYVFDEDAADIYGKTFSLQYELKSIPHYNFYHIYGDIEIDGVLYPCNQWIMCPNTPIAKSIWAIIESIKMITTGYTSGVFHFSKYPNIVFANKNGYQLRLITQAGYNPCIQIYKDNTDKKAQYNSFDYSEYSKEHYSPAYQEKSYIEK